MDVLKLKENCNANYRKCISLLENKGSLNAVHDLLVVVIEQLLTIGEVSPADKSNATNRAVKLFNIAKGIDTDSTYDSIYFELLGRHLPEEKVISVDSDDDQEEVKEEKRVISNPRIEVQNPLRPLKLDDYIGQDGAKVQLGNAIKAAKLRGTPLKHIILFGNAGLGKTTLSRIIANEMESGFIEMNGPAIKDVQGFAKIFSRINEGDVVFIDEIHRLPTACAEAIYSAMEDYRISYMAKDPGSGESKNVTINLPKFTLVGATTHSGMLAKPLLDRFVLQFHLKPYTDEDIAKIVVKSFSKLNLECSEMCAMEIAKRSRGIPRKANAFVEQLSDKALLAETSIVDFEMIDSFFEELKINDSGLDSFDMDYLNTINNKYGGGPVGLDTICSALSVDKNIVENQIEPYLLFKGLIMISSGGRELSSFGKEYLHNLTKESEKEKNINYFVNLLEDHQYEKLIINLCLNLENVLKNKFGQVGTFQEMIDSYCEDINDENIKNLLHKLRMKRNDFVHPNDRDTELSDSEIMECINYICGLED